MTQNNVDKKKKEIQKKPCHSSWGKSYLQENIFININQTTTSSPQQNYRYIYKDGKRRFPIQQLSEGKNKDVSRKKSHRGIYISDLNPVYKIYRRLYLLLLNKIEK